MTRQALQQVRWSAEGGLPARQGAQFGPGRPLGRGRTGVLVPGAPEDAGPAEAPRRGLALHEVRAARKSTPAAHPVEPDRTARRRTALRAPGPRTCRRLQGEQTSATPSAESESKSRLGEPSAGEVERWSSRRTGRAAAGARPAHERPRRRPGARPWPASREARRRRLRRYRRPARGRPRAPSRDRLQPPRPGSPLPLREAPAGAPRARRGSPPRRARSPNRRRRRRLCAARSAAR